MRAITALVICLSAGTVFGAPCQSGTSPDFPGSFSECYSEDEGERRPLVGIQTCNKYLLCDPITCRWTETACPEGWAYSQPYEECEERKESDCSANLFGPSSRVIITNVGTGKVIDDCQGCFNNNYGFPAASPIIANDLNGDRGNTQIWVGTKVDRSKYYGFALAHKDGSRSKILTQRSRVAGGTVMFSQLTDDGDNYTYRNNIRWEIVPIDADQSSYQIKNPVSGQTLAVADYGLNVFYPDGSTTKPKMIIKDFDQSDAAQLWTFTFLDQRMIANSTGKTI